MTLETLVQLARSRTPADRSRIQLATAALGLTGALLLGALRIARLGSGALSEAVYSSYVAESGLRSGLISILAILALLTAGLAVQALRLGTAARERRLAALRLAGASRRQVRQLTVADGAMAGLAGGLLAGPVYLVLSLFFEALPRTARILPGAELLDVLVWVPVVVATTAAGAVIGSLLHPNESPRDVRPAVQRRTGIIVGPVLIVIGMATVRQVGIVASAILVVGLLVLFLSTSGLWIRAIGRRLTSSGDPANLLAGVRLVTDSRAVSRMCMLLAVCGFLVGALANETVSVLSSPFEVDTPSFYVTGYGMAAAGLLLVALTAMAALIVGVADQLVDQRRQLACLTALGVDLPFLRRVIRRQLTAVAAPALAAGLLVGTVLGLDLVARGVPGPLDPTILLIAAGLAVAGWLLGHLGSVTAGYLLRDQLRDALDPENLRAA